MLIWAKKNEVNIEVISSIEAFYNKRKKLNNLKDILKGWELSVICRQIKRHFGKRQDISILDFGAGVSPLGAYLDCFGYKFVTCMDKEGGRHRKMNEELYNKIYGSYVTYIKRDVVSSYTGKHDVILSASVLEHIREEERLAVLQALWVHLAVGGLFIHVVDYDKGVDFKRLIDNNGISISYRPKETPGCKEFKRPPADAWMIKGESRIAFFNEKEA